MKIFLDTTLKHCDWAKKTRDVLSDGSLIPKKKRRKMSVLRMDAEFERKHPRDRRGRWIEKRLPSGLDPKWSPSKEYASSIRSIFDSLNEEERGLMGAINAPQDNNGVTVLQHTANMMKYLERQAELNARSIGRMSSRYGVDLGKVLSHGAALHDIGKSIAGRFEQHEHTGPIFKDVLARNGFSPREIEIGWSLYGADPIGEHAKGFTSAEEARGEISDLSSDIGMDYGDFLFLQSLIYLSDVSAYPQLKSFLIEEDSGGRLSFTGDAIDNLRGPSPRLSTSRYQQTMRGEFWLMGSSAIGADGDVDDMNHEGHAMQSASQTVAGAIEGLDTDDVPGFDEMDEDDQDMIRSALEEVDPYSEWVNVDPILSAFEDTGAWPEALEDLYKEDPNLFDVARGIGNVDARIWAAHKEGWVRLAGNNLQMVGISNSKLKDIASGLWEAYGDDVETQSFDLEVVAWDPKNPTKIDSTMYYDVPYPDIEGGRVADLREYKRLSALRMGRKYDESKHPRDERGRWTDKGKSSAPAGYQEILDAWGVSSPEELLAQANKELSRLFGSPEEVEPTEEEARGVQLGVRQPGECFVTAGQYIIKHADREGVKLIHGVCASGDMLIAHGWVEMGDKVYDGTHGKFFDKKSYYDFTQATVEREYTPREAMVKMIETGHWGCWHDSRGIWKK